jgi:5-methylcytosine-specific restriction protein A
MSSTAANGSTASDPPSVDSDGAHRSTVTPMTARACLDCGEPSRAGSRCPDCDRGHRLGWAWSARRDVWLAYHPECASCGVPATEVDHLVARFRGGQDVDNLQSLCHPCHVAKTARERGS